MNYSIMYYRYYVLDSIQEFNSKFQSFKSSKFQGSKFQSFKFPKLQDPKFETSQI